MKRFVFSRQIHWCLNEAKILIRTKDMAKLLRRSECSVPVTVQTARAPPRTLPALSLIAHISGSNQHFRNFKKCMYFLLSKELFHLTLDHLVVLGNDAAHKTCA